MSEPVPENVSAVPEKPRKTRWRRRFVFLLVFAGVLVVGIRALLPAALRRGAEYAVETQLGLQLQVGNIDLWLLDGALAIDDLRLARPAADPDIRLARGFVRVDLRALLGRRIDVLDLSLEAPQLQMHVLPDGRIDVLGLAQAEEGTEAASVEPAEAFVPWPLLVRSVSLQDADVRVLAPEEENGEAAVLLQLAVDQLALGDVGLDGRRLAVDSVEVNGPALRLRRSFVFGDALTAEQRAELQEEAVTVETKVEEASLDYSVGRVVVGGAEFTLLSDAATLDVDFELTVAEIKPEVGHAFPVRFQLRIGEGSLDIDGRLGLNPLSYEGKVRWADLPLPPVSVAAKPDLATWIRSCRAGGDLDVEARWGAADGTEEAGRRLRLSGRTVVEDLLVEDPEEEELAVGFKKFELVIEQAELVVGEGAEQGGRHTIDLQRLHIVEPVFRYTYPSEALTRFQATLAGDPADESAEPAPAAEAAAGPMPQISLAALEIERAEADFIDRSTEPIYHGRVRGLNVTAADLRFPERQARRVQIRGEIPKKGKFEVNGNVESTSAEVEAQLDHVRLTPFSAYAERASGYRLKRGELSLQSKLSLQDARYETENEVTLHRLVVSGRGEGRFRKAIGVPLDVALALLRDQRGNIELSVPLVADAGGTRIGLREVLTDALREAVLGAMVSPLKMLGGSLASAEDGEITMEPLRAVSGSAALAAGEEQRVQAIGTLLADRPGLALQLQGRVSKKDRRLLAEGILVEMVQADKDLPTVEGESWRARRRVVRALQARAAGEAEELDDDERALLRRYAAAVELPEQELKKLADERVQGVRDVLTSKDGVDAARVTAADTYAEGRAGVILEIALPGAEESATQPPRAD